MRDTLKFLIPGKPEYYKIAKVAIGSAAGTANFDVQAIEDIEIAVGEACRNISCHGFDGFSNFYEVECEIEPKKITITVTDCCGEHGLEKHKKPCLDCPKEGDLGVYVMKSLMNEVEIIKKDSGNSIRMVKHKC